MISDEERRWSAQALRDMPCDMTEVEESWRRLGIETSCRDQTDYYLIHGAVMGCLPADEMHPCDYEELHERLAGLIDRPTCEMAGDMRARYATCTRCAAAVRRDAIAQGKVAYCPSCGAEVVGDERRLGDVVSGAQVVCSERRAETAMEFE